MRVDVRANHKSNDVEERYPDLLWQKLLRESKGYGGSDPRDLHHGHKAGTNSGADLMEGFGAGNDGHGDEIDGILDW